MILIKTLYKLFTKLLRFLCIITITIYRHTISPLLAPRCRFYPTCSSYSMMLLKNKDLSIFYIIFKIIQRILKCNPLYQGGVDFPCGERTCGKN